MTISPVTFVNAPPIVAIRKVERVKRRPNSMNESGSESSAPEVPGERTYAATSPEEFASDETRAALLNIRLGG